MLNLRVACCSTADPAFVLERRKRRRNSPAIISTSHGNAAIIKRNSSVLPATHVEKGDYKLSCHLQTKQPPGPV